MPGRPLEVQPTARQSTAIRFRSITGDSSVLLACCRPQTPLFLCSGLDPLDRKPQAIEQAGRENQFETHFWFSIFLFSFFAAPLYTSAPHNPRVGLLPCALAPSVGQPLPSSQAGFRGALHASVRRCLGKPHTSFPPRVINCTARPSGSQTCTLSWPWATGPCSWEQLCTCLGHPSGCSWDCESLP